MTISLAVKSYGKPARGWELSSAKIQTQGKFPTGDFKTEDELLIKKVDAWASPGFSFHCSAPKIFQAKEGDDKAHARLEVKVRHESHLVLVSTSFPVGLCQSLSVLACISLS